MHEYLSAYLKYNLWANRIITGYFEKAGKESLDITIESSFPSIRKTWYHIWDAQCIWILRLEGKEVTTWPGRDFTGTMKEAIYQFMESTEKLAELGLQLDAEKLITYKNLSGKEFTNKVWHILMHVVNHGTYHRGQLVTMLRQAGMKELQPLDMIVFTRQQ
ncbi:MAG: DinB family protein [Bacteroidia bacterium]|nr:DinB family protein [Bacteroidia bacterium]